MSFAYALASEIRFVGQPVSSWFYLYQRSLAVVVIAQVVVLTSTHRLPRATRLSLPVLQAALVALSAATVGTAILSLRPDEGYSRVVFGLDCVTAFVMTLVIDGLHAHVTRALTRVAELSRRLVVRLEDASRRRAVVTRQRGVELSRIRLAFLIDPLFLLLVAMLPFGGAVVRGQAVSPADLTFHFQPWYSQSPEIQSPYNANLYDDLFAVYTREFLAREQLRNGDLPLWSSAVGGGIPLLAAENFGAIDPFNLATIWAPPPYLQIWLLRSVLKLFVAGLGAYVFLRALGARRESSLFAAVSFMLSSFLFDFLMLSHSSVLAFLPWAYWATWKLVRSTGRAARLGAAALVALFTGAQILAGQPEILAYTMLSVGAWCSVLLLGQPVRSWASNAAWLGGAFVWGFALGAVQLLPAVELVLAGAFPERTNVGLSSYLPLTQSIQWLVPNFFGGPVADFNEFGKYILRESSYYVGIGSLLFALAILRTWRDLPVGTRLVALFMAVQVAVAVGVGYHLPLADQVALTPVLSNTLLHRLMLLASFSVCMLGGLGMDAATTRAFGSGGNGRRPAHVRGYVLPMAAGLIVTAPLFGGRRSLLTEALYRDSSAGNIAAFQATWSIFAAVIIVGFSVLIWRNRRIGSRRLWSQLCLGLAVLDLVVVQFAYYPSSGTSWRIPPTELTNTLATLTNRDPTVRISAAGSTLPPNTSAVFGLSDLRAFTLPVPSHLPEFMTATETARDPAIGPVLHDLYFVQAGSDPQLLAFAGVRYYVTPMEYRPVLAAANTSLTGNLIDLSAGPQRLDFVSSREGLASVQILLNTYGEPREPGAVRLTLTDDDGHAVTDQVSGPLTSGWARFDFAPTASPTGALFHLQLSTTLPARKIATYAATVVANAHLLTNGVQSDTVIAFTASAPLPASMTKVATSAPLDIWALSDARPYLEVAGSSLLYSSFADGIRIARDAGKGTVVLPTGNDARLSGGTGGVRLLDYRPGRVTADVNATSGSVVLVLRESPTPGWSATIDGTSTATFSADLLYQGIAVPPGEHHVEFSYRPASLIPGIVLTAASASALGLVALVAMWRGRAKRRLPAARAASEPRADPEA